MTAIRTPDQRLRIFVSSTMKELASARAAARGAIERLRLIPVLFELGARPYPPRDLYLAYLRQSDVFIGIYGQQYGWIAPDQEISGLEDEYLNAGGLPKLVYVQSPAPDRDPRLSEMLSRIQSDGLSYRGFGTNEELGTLIADDLAVLLSERFDLGDEPPAARRPSRQLPTPASRFIGREHEKSILRDLLTDGELGVFAAGFSLQAAETVCADDSVPAVLDGITSLLDKSLVRTEDPLHGQPRFTMLQVVRDFALEQLDAFGETEPLRRAHADYYQGAVIADETTLRRDPVPVIEKYHADQANIRAAIRWSLDVGEGGRVARMLVAMWPFLWIAGLLSEGVEAAQQALVDETLLSPAERADACLALRMLAFGQGEYERATPALATAIDLYTQLGDAQHAATASVPLGVIQALGDPDGGEDLLESAADTFRNLDDQWGLAFASLNLGGALLLHDRYADAIPHLEETIQHARAVKADVFMSNALINLGWIHHWLGDLESARRRLREAVKHAAVPDNRVSLARALDALAALALAAGDPEQGATLLGAADGVRRSIGAEIWMTDRASHDQTAAELRTRLGGTAYAAATDRGRSLTFDQVLELSSAE